MAGGMRIFVGAERSKALADHAGRAVVMGVRPETMSSQPQGRFAGEDNILPVTVNVVEVLGDKMDVHMSTGEDVKIVARVDAHETLKEEQQENMHLDIDKVHFFEPGDTGANLCLGGVSAGVEA